MNTLTLYRRAPFGGASADEIICRENPGRGPAVCGMVFCSTNCSKRTFFRAELEQMFDFHEFSLTITAENLKRLRAKLPPKPKSPFSSTPTYVAIERAVVLGSEQSFEGKVFILEPDGRLKPICGKDLAALHRDFPNFVREWK